MIMTQNRFAVWVALLAVALATWVSCTRSTPFGADLLDDQVADYAFTDTLTLKCSLQYEENIITGNVTGSTMLCGEVTDPQFGKTKIDLYSGLTFNKTDLNLNGARVDSVVLFLKYKTSAVYGDTTQIQTLKVFQLEDSVRYGKEYLSTEKLPAGTELGSLRFLPKPNKRDSISPTVKTAVVRVKLDRNFGETLKDLSLDSLTRVKESVFAQKIKGLKIISSADGGVTPGAMLAFDLSDKTASFIRLYYMKDTSRLSADYIFSGNSLTLGKFVNIEHDYSNTAFKDKIGAAAEDFFYVQGAGGLQIKVELPYASKLDNIIVNKAELVLTAQDPANPLLPIPGQLFLTESLNGRVLISSDSLTIKGLLSHVWRIPTSDVTRSTDANYSIFGGQPTKETINGTMVSRYRLNLSERLQAAIDDTTGDPSKHIFFVNVFPQRTSTAGVVLHGPKSTTFPAKLELKYTRIR